ncbi:MAG: molybdopterin-containing oxidoreductase family protein [Syntrophales bacterium]
MPLVPTFCGKDCGGNACPLLAVVEEGRVKRVRYNPAGGRYIRGCPRGLGLPRETAAPDRILTPLVRTGPRGSGTFRPADWDEALAITARNLGEISAKYGPHAVMSFSGFAVTGALHGTHALLTRFMNLFGGSTRLTGNYSNAAVLFTLPYILGGDWVRSGYDAATMRHSEMIVLWGANVLETRMGAEVDRRLLEAGRRGARIVVVGPRRSFTAERTGAWWIPCLPGTDAALMLAVLYVLITEGLLDRGFVDSHCTGFDRLERYVLGRAGGAACTPGWAAGICGAPAGEIVAFARAYAAAKPALLLPGYAIQRVFAGEEAYRLTVALQAATGNFGVAGGSTGAANRLLPLPRVGRLGIPPVVPQPSLPIVRWPDAILEGRAGGYPSDVRALYNLGGNPINQGADITKSIAAFRKLDFAVSHEVFLTPTALHCDVIFPAATALEKEDIGLPWAGNYLLYKPAATAPRGLARSDYDALWALAERLGFGAAFSEGRTATDWVEEFIASSEVPDPDAFRRTGIYRGPEAERVGLAAFAADPEKNPLDTPSGRIEIASDRYRRETGFPAIPTWQPRPLEKGYPLRMVTPKSRHYTHSQSNFILLPGRDAHALTMHPAAAAGRGIREGETVRVLNARGEGRIAVRISEEVMPGVVSLPEGVWVSLDGEGRDRRGSANMFTSTGGTTPAVACIMHGINVEVCPTGS